MPTTRHTYEADWDAPFERISIEFDYSSAVAPTGPSYASGGEPGEDADVEVIRCRGRIEGVWHDLPDYFEPAFLKACEDDLYAMGSEHDDDVRAWRRGGYGRAA